MNREFDIIVWGATGFTGRLVAENLLGVHGVGGDLRWALGGRSRDKLREVRDALGDTAGSLELVLADSHDRSSLETMAARTQVVLTTVGPYALHGSDLVAACLATGTDYCDLTGEVPWMRRMLDEHVENAERSQARIVHCCGFDSIPSDMGVLFMQQEAQKKLGEPLSAIRCRVKAMRGGASGGTVDSMLNIAEEARKDAQLRRVLKNPYALCPPELRSGVRQPYVSSAGWDEDFDAAVAPFVMAAINTRIVHRSHALAGRPWGDDFRYDEAMLTGKGMAGRIRATGVSIGLGAFMLGAAFAPTRMLMKKTFLPDAGEGPSEETRKSGFWKILLAGETADGQELRASVSGQGDPGYGSTCRMISEAAVCLATSADDENRPNGFLTPASAMGDTLLQRLQDNAGVSFEVLG